MTRSMTSENENVKATAERWLSAMNTLDVMALLPCYRPDATSFVPGELLAEGGHTKANLEAAFSAGLKWAVQWRHLDVKVFGKAAVTTGYMIGTTTLPDGTVLRGPWRISMMWVKEESGWQIVHFHGSALNPVHGM